MSSRLTVIVPALRGYDAVSAAIAAWEAQHDRDALEVLVMCPAHTALPEAPPAWLTVVQVPSDDLHDLRAEGVRRARAGYVMVAEDHCLPDPDWATAILSRLDEGWDGIGSVLRPGRRDSAWPEGAFLLGYGEWMGRREAGEVAVLCGWNGTLRRERLLAMGEGLERELVVGAFMIRRLRREGARFLLESRARMRHFDYALAGIGCWQLLLVGAGFGALRTRGWPLPARALYPLLAPAVAAAHWKRALVHYLRAGRAMAMTPWAVATAGVLAICWGAGEAVGAWLGVTRVAPWQRIEVKPPTLEAVAALARWEGGRAGG